MKVMCRGRGCRGVITLAEVVMALAVSALAFGGLIMGYNQAVFRAQWSAYSLAAQSLASQRVEQTRSAMWDPRGFTTTNGAPTDQLTASNFPNTLTNVLDIPISGTNMVYAANYTTITDLSSSNVPLRMVRVDCVWNLCGRGPYTNTVVTYRAPDR